MSKAGAAFEDFVAARGPALLRFAYTLCGDAGLAEDLLQEALAACWPTWRRIRRLDQPEAYVRRVILNRFRSTMRKRSSTEIVGLRATAVEQDHQAGAAERDQMWRALTCLTPAQRAVLVLRYYEDLPDKQIAHLLRCSDATVRSHAARAFAVLRDSGALQSRRGATP
jgi:RNA polymerase sigma-70 factor (sigma-E family)